MEAPTRRVVVYHRSYGCDTGCCGHYVEVDDVEVPGSWAFSHPFGDDRIAFAREVIEDALDAEHVADLDWDNCLVLDD